MNDGGTGVDSSMKPGNYVVMTEKFGGVPVSNKAYRVRSYPFAFNGMVCVFLDGWLGCVSIDQLKVVRRIRPPKGE